MNALETAWKLCGVIQNQMGLTNEQVWIYDQKRDVPNQTKLWVVVRFLTGKPFGNVSRVDGGVESQELHMNAVYTVDIFSRDVSALARKDEIIMAFGSQYAQRQQEIFSFKIARLPLAFTDLSLVEGAAIPYRFSINLQVQYTQSKEQTVDYYDIFSDTLTTEA